ncbi:MAG: hypothetical protein JSV28_10630 [Deltaproteobacteria bacterium]|nr:MAG: hypothetical protein JSV28_10630 [Deltaproteobacteria bacterium]
MRNRMLLLPALGALLLAMAAITAHAEERTVVGTIVRVDAAERTLTVKDGKGVAWNYKADQDAGISLEGLHVGDRVSVTIGRPTPFNMITAADRLRKGDRVTRIPF